MLVKFIFNLLSIFLSVLFMSRKEMVLKLMVVMKEKEILKRRLGLKNTRINFSSIDKCIFAFISRVSSAFHSVFSLAKPETVLKWYHRLISKRWTFPAKTKSAGRPQIPIAVKNLVLRMKNENIFMRSGKIQGELKKLGIDLSVSTIRRILREFRRQGKIRKSLTWMQFIKSHLDSLFAMDFLTVDSLFGKRFYVFFIIFIKTRKIFQFGITDVPCHNFVRNQLFGFIEDRSVNKPYLIHDRAGEFLYQDYKSLGIKNIPISPKSPNMNAYAERFVGSIRREALDSFIIVNYRQLYSIVREYIEYYNSMRPHQGIDQNSRKGMNRRFRETLSRSPYFRDCGIIITEEQRKQKAPFEIIFLANHITRRSFSFLFIPSIVKERCFPVKHHPLAGVSPDTIVFVSGQNRGL